MNSQQVLKVLLGFAKPYKFRLLFSIANAVLATLVSSLLAPYLLSQIFIQLQSGQVSLSANYSLIGWYALIQIYSNVIGWRLVTWNQSTLALKMTKDVHDQIFSRLVHESADFHANHFGGALVSQYNKFLGAVESLWDVLLWMGVPFVVTILSTVIFMSFVFWPYALVMLIITVAFLSLAFVRSRFLGSRNKAASKANSKITGVVADALSNTMLVKSNAQEQYELTRAQAYVSDYHQKSRYALKGILLMSASFGGLNALLSIMAIIVAFAAAERQWLSVGMIYLVLTYTMQMARQLYYSTNLLQSYYRIIGNAGEMAEILMTKNTIVDKTHKKLQIKKGTVEFKNVSYAYQSGAGVQIFNDFNLQIKAGQRVGVVGRSGSGKTSLTRILLRFSDVDHGEVLIDNQDITKVSQESLHKSIAYVPQESSLFHRSIRDNIAYGKPNATEAEIIKSAKEANAWEFIAKLPEGLDTMVGERGVKLSGGQRQRIAIARAILKNSPILVLDEATSALDSESEKLIQDSLDNLMKNRTSLVIAHRLSTIAKLDRIIVLDQGQIVEDGTHDQLIKQKGIYAKLWQHQSGGFIESEE